MRRQDFEHVIRAAAAVVQDEIVVIGSQAILGQYPNAPTSLLMSMEVDVFPRNDPARADEIDGAIGDGSRFHQRLGVDLMPDGHRERTRERLADVIARVGR